MPDSQSLLQKISNEGFSLDEIGRRDLVIAFLSLRSAINAWFSTYQCFRNQFINADPNSDLNVVDENESDIPEYVRNYRRRLHPLQYFEAYSEAILRFHHFFELVLKSILRSEHELLAGEIKNHPVLLYQLLKNEKVDIEQLRKIKSLEFSDSLLRVVSLVQNKKLDAHKYQFIVDNKNILEKLNEFRNRLVHRGTFVLPYASLDEFVGICLLPIVNASTQLPGFSGKENLWKYPALSCEIDPINEICEVMKTDPINFQEIALIKELGRAAYLNPIPRRGIVVDLKGIRRRSEAIAKQEVTTGNSGIFDVLNCPVCGCKSLLRMFDIESENPDPENPGKLRLFTYQIECLICTFEINQEISNASNFNLPIDDYWTSEFLDETP
jgi:hypothetical protein